MRQREIRIMALALPIIDEAVPASLDECWPCDGGRRPTPPMSPCDPGETPARG